MMKNMVRKLWDFEQKYIYLFVMVGWVAAICSIVLSAILPGNPITFAAKVILVLSFVIPMFISLIQFFYLKED